MVLLFILLLLTGKAVTQLLLERANGREVLRHAGEVPEAFREFIDAASYGKAVDTR